MRFFYLTIAVVLLASCAKRIAPLKISNQIVNIQIDKAVEGDSYGPCEPSIAVSPTNPDNMVAGAILNRVYYSHDAGLTWQKKVLKSSTHGVFGDPVIVADYKDNFYYAHLSDPSGEGWSDDRLLDRIVIQRSSDIGQTWNDGSSTEIRHPKDQDKQWLAVDPTSGDLYITWTEFDVYGSEKPTDNSRILFSKSTDMADSWSAPIAINERDGDCLDGDNTVEGAVPAVGPNGEVYVAWSGHKLIYFDRSLDGGESWWKNDRIISKQFSGWDLDVNGISRTNGMPITKVDISQSKYKGRVYVNWADARTDGDQDIWLSFSDDRGSNWSKPIRVNDDKTNRDQFFTWMDIDQTNGNIYVVFYDRRAYDDLRTDVYLAYSNDGGKSFTNKKISQTPFTPSSQVFFGDYNNISCHGGIVRPIWTRYDQGKLSVWTAIINVK